MTGRVIVLKTALSLVLPGVEALAVQPTGDTLKLVGQALKMLHYLAPTFLCPVSSPATWVPSAFDECGQQTWVPSHFRLFALSITSQSPTGTVTLSSQDAFADSTNMSPPCVSPAYLTHQSFAIVGMHARYLLSQKGDLEDRTAFISVSPESGTRLSPQRKAWVAVNLIKKSKILINNRLKPKIISTPHQTNVKCERKK